MKNETPVSYLRECLRYDPLSGLLSWLERPITHFASKRANSSWNARYAHATAASLDDKGYIRVRINGKTHKSHRIAWALYYGQTPMGEIDHIDGCKTNNRISNLRCVDSTGNKMNMPKQSNNKSGTTGVCYHKESGKWNAYISIEGKFKTLGRFSTKDEAIIARENAQRLSGYHQNHGR